mmetsp:Transcript_24511/g.77472  ORF Transcript_24511/g.77472 Transcript_24511/m.77472 type:complete len:245 (-) Transcript_24511:852-1586(-)
MGGPHARGLLRSHAHLSLLRPPQLPTAPAAHVGHQPEGHAAVDGGHVRDGAVLHLAHPRRVPGAQGAHRRARGGAHDVLDRTRGPGLAPRVPQPGEVAVGRGRRAPRALPPGLHPLPGREARRGGRREQGRAGEPRARDDGGVLPRAATARGDAPARAAAATQAGVRPGVRAAPQAPGHGRGGGPAPRGGVRLGHRGGGQLVLPEDLHLAAVDRGRGADAQELQDVQQAAGAGDLRVHDPQPVR